MGSAISLFSCDGTTVPTKEISFDTLMNEQSDSLVMVMSENGRTSYRFITSRVEGYTLAKEPYREFPKGVEIITYQSDSMKVVDATLTANYAIYYEERKLWEAMGDVTVIKSDGKELYSQQLFWNAVTQKIYSNVDTKIVDNATGDIYIGEGFESDESMENWSFRRMKGRMGVDLTPKPRDVDSLAVDSLSVASTDSLSTKRVAKGAKVDASKSPSASTPTKNIKTVNAASSTKSTKPTSAPNSPKSTKSTKPTNAPKPPKK